MRLENILAKIEELRIIKEEIGALFEKDFATQKELDQELISEGLIYVSHYFYNFTKDFTNFFQYNNSFYSSKISDFLLPDLFYKANVQKIYFEVYCIKSKQEVIVFKKSRGSDNLLLKFSSGISLSESEYAKLLDHPDKEKLLQFLLSDKENGYIAKLILSDK